MLDSLRLPAVLAVALNLVSQSCFGLVDAFTALVVPIACHGGATLPTSMNAPNSAASRAVFRRSTLRNMVSSPATTTTSESPIILKSRVFEETNRSSLALSVQKGTQEAQPQFGTFQHRLSFPWAAPCQKSIGRKRVGSLARYLHSQSYDGYLLWARNSHQDCFQRPPQPVVCQELIRLEDSCADFILGQKVETGAILGVLRGVDHHQCGRWARPGECARRAHANDFAQRYILSKGSLQARGRSACFLRTPSHWAFDW
jgi:hypothetical protein